MVQHETNLVVADNTGAKSVRVFHLCGGFYRKSAGIGDIVVVSVKDALPDGKAKKGDVCKAVIVRVKKEYQRPDGSFIRFDDNACVLRTCCKRTQRWWLYEDHLLGRGSSLI